MQSGDHLLTVLPSSLVRLDFGSSDAAKKRQIVQELTVALIQVWEEIPLDTIHRLIRSTHKLCRGVQTGGYTHTTEPYL